MTTDTPLLPAPEERKLLPAPDRAPPSPHGDRGDARRRRRVVLIAVAAVAVLLLIGWFFHHRRAAAAKEAAERERNRLPSVVTMAVASSAPLADLRLPGSVTALTEASLFARANGYLRVRYVDIGDTVRRGQVIAEIDAPDLDQQLAMAREQLLLSRSAVNDAVARVDLARVTYQRLATLVKDLAVSQQQADQGKQDLDTATAGVASARANVGAAQANVDRLVALQGFEKIRAPFDGIVTARNVDVGALVNASGANSGSTGNAGVGSMSSSAQGSSSGGGSQSSNSSGSEPTELFRVAQSDRVRVFVTVPQENAAALSPDTAATVFVQGIDTPFDGSVTRSAQSFDPSARTMLVEVQVANPRRTLVPGMYAEVRFKTARRGAPLLVPGEAVIARASGLSVAVVEELRPQDKARLPKPEDLPKPGDQPKSGKRDDDAKSSSSSDNGAVDDRGGRTVKGEKEDDKSGKQGGGKAGPGQGEGQADTDDDTNLAHARRIHLQAVEVGRDYGTEIEITRGLRAGQQIVANPGDDVSEGALVMPRPRQDAGDGGTGKGGGERGEPASKGDPKATPGPLGPDAPPAGNESPSREAPTKGR